MIALLLRSSLHFSLLSHFQFTSLMLSRPDVLKQTLFRSQTAQGVISFRSETNSSGQSEGDIRAGGTTFGIDFDEVDLDGSVVFGSD